MRSETASQAVLACALLSVSPTGHGAFLCKFSRYLHLIQFWVDVGTYNKKVASSTPFDRSKGWSQARAATVTYEQQAKNFVFFLDELIKASQEGDSWSDGCVWEEEWVGCGQQGEERRRFP